MFMCKISGVLLQWWKFFGEFSWKFPWKSLPIPAAANSLWSYVHESASFHDSAWHAYTHLKAHEDTLIYNEYIHNRSQMCDKGRPENPRAFTWDWSICLIARVWEHVWLRAAAVQRVNLTRAQNEPHVRISNILLTAVIKPAYWGWNISDPLRFQYSLELISVIGSSSVKVSDWDFKKWKMAAFLTSAHFNSTDLYRQESTLLSTPLTGSTFQTPPHSDTSLMYLKNQINRPV